MLLRLIAAEIRRLTQGAINSVTKEDWNGCFQDVMEK
jgi:hypothetical protein